ncbi:MAG: DedA family protein [Nitrospirae bacterium]|nr:DedA family protein [Nitrospirota bacterium]MCL5420930.1 DedA family protein [Nitrospirota bacterium]
MLQLSSLLEHFPYAGLFILLILGGIGLPFPEDTTLILCGFLISHTIVKPVPALLAVYSGLLVADLFLFYVGRKYGRMIVTHKRFHKILSPERLSMLEDKFNKRGVLVILFGRHLLGLRAQIFLVAGVMRMSALKFLLTDAFTSLFTIAMMVGAGYIGGNSLQIIKKDISRIEHVAIFLIVIFLALFFFFRYIRSGRKQSL